MDGSGIGHDCSFSVDVEDMAFFLMDEPSVIRYDTGKVPDLERAVLRIGGGKEGGIGKKKQNVSACSGWSES